jgi:hypothetical protein
MKGGIKRTLTDVEGGAGDLVKALRNRPSMPRLQREGLQDEKVERSLWKVEAILSQGRTPFTSTGG